MDRKEGETEMRKQEKITNWQKAGGHEKVENQMICTKLG